VKNLTVSLIQCPLVWENAEANRQQFERRLAKLEKTDLVLLPEMFNSGFSMNSEKIAEAVGGPTETWMRAMASQYDCAIAGSIAVRDGNGISNRMLFVTPQEIHYYDKRHLFRMSGENNHYLAGAERRIVYWRDWRLCLQVCYDLRYPVWSRNCGDFDALIYVANWPATRSYHWRQLIIARAIENQTCVLGLNRIGDDDNGIHYSGDSMAIAADGEILLDGKDEDGIFTTVLDAERQVNYREKFPSHLDGDDFILNI
jgi:predicted amidohydrolase